MTKPLPPEARRTRRAPTTTPDTPAPRAWTLDPERLETTCALLYTLGGQETCVEVIAWREGDAWPDAEADEGWTRLLGEGVDPQTVRIDVPAHHHAMIRRRGRDGGPDSAWTTVQAFRAEPGAVSLSEDPFGIWLSIDGFVRGARIERPEPDDDGRHPVSGERMQFVMTNGVDALPPCPTLLELTLTHDAYLRALHFLRDFPALRALNLSNCSYVDWIEPLAELRDLESLRLRWCDEGGFGHESLRGLPRLRVLDISFTHVTSLGFLRNIRRLERLELEGNGELRSLRGIEALRSLRTLDLSRCTGLRDLRPLAFHPSLETLRLRGAHDELDLSALATIPSLRLLDLRECHARRGHLRLARRKGLTVLTARRPPEPRRKRWRQPPGPPLRAGQLVRVNHGAKAPPKGWMVMETCIESVAFLTTPRPDGHRDDDELPEELIWHGEVMHVRAGTVPAGACRIRPAQGCRVWCPTRGTELYARRDAFEVIGRVPPRADKPSLKM